MWSEIARIGFALLSAMLLVACGGATSSTPASSTASASGTASASPDPARLTVPAVANIFGAGHGVPPAPAGSGGGMAPPVFMLPPGDNRIVTFVDANGGVVPQEGRSTYNGPEGDLKGATDIESYDGISGIIHEHNGMFLTGVFLTDDEPEDPAPERLDFTEEDFDLLAPQIGQTFFIGDGVGHRYEVPDGATRIFVGFADAYFYSGPPGYYSNNFGTAEVSVKVTVD